MSAADVPPRSSAGAAAPSLAGGISCLADVVRVQARLRPDAIALECGGERRTFGELRERSARVASALGAELDAVPTSRTARATAPGDSNPDEAGSSSQPRIAVLARNSLPILELTFGAAMRNAVAVQLNWRLAPPEIAQILADSEARLLVVGEEFAPVVERIEHELAHVRTVLVIGEHPRWASYEAWLEQHPPDDPGVVGGADDVALQLYTSGTTGLPKGVMLTNDNVFGALARVNEWWKFDPSDSVNLALMPLFHIAGLAWSVLGLTFGCRTVVLPDVDVDAILDALRGGVTHAFMVPAVIQFLLAAPGVTREDFASLRLLVYGASPISVSVLTKALEVIGCELVQVYGLTETTGAVTQLLSTEHDPVGRPDLLRSCGKPFPWVEVRIVEPDTGSDIEGTGEGAVGELWIRSRQVMAGYWHNPAATHAAITPEGWLRTGDAGYRDAEGFLYLYDRVKDMIVTGGENVYPAEVENALMAHPDVADVAVVGVPDERWGEAVKAVVVPVPTAQPDPAVLVAFCHERLAGYKCPKSIDFADSLPRNPSGKLLKREIRRPYWQGSDRFIG
jgi:long-chain acyl-CoA synthetase